MRTSSRFAPAICLLIVLGAGSTARAATIYNNFGPSGEFSDIGFLLAGPTNISIGTEVDQAAAITLGPGNFFVTSITVGISVTGPLPFDGTGPIDLVITEDAGGLPGNSLASVQQNENVFGKQAVTFALPAVHLAGNATYWIALEPKNSFDGSWAQNSTGATDPAAGRSNGGAWSLHSNEPSFALKVEGRIGAVPEPASVGLLATGLLGMLAGLRSRRRSA